jgi:glycine C-acetyltransferase
MFGDLKKVLQGELNKIKEAGLYKEERVLETPQGVVIKTNGKEVLNFCANNYLGFCNDPDLLAAAKKALDKYGYGMSSVRFICGTLDIHKELEKTVSRFLGTEDTILYSSCFDANAGLFETLLHEGDVVISDKLNHASIIDGIRLSKAERKVFAHGDMADLEEQLKQSSSFKTRLICTDGVFSMDGEIAKLKDICSLAEKYEALVMVDDSHATGVLGPGGRGTPAFYGVQDKVDIVTSTFGKALGGAAGGFTSGRREIIQWLRQRSRPYLFSNTLAPVITATTLVAIRLLEGNSSRQQQLLDNTRYFRENISKLGFELRGGEHPIVPVMLYDATLAKSMANELLSQGIYVVGFSYPVVPQGQARIRVQISAAHTKEHLDKALAAFEKVGKQHNIVKR